MNRKFVSKSNLVLRKILNSKDNIYILKDFIESFLNLNIKEIYLNSYLNSKSKCLKHEENFGVADVRIVLEDLRELNIGMQFIDGYYVQNKILLYYAQIHSNQLEYNKERKPAETVTINILDFNYFNSEEYHKKIFINSKEDENGISEKMEFHVLELPKFELNDKEKIGRKEAWMIYLCGNNDKMIENVLKDFKIIKKLDDLLEEYWINEKME